MQVSKWGNSLAVLLPAALVEALDLTDGDVVEISTGGKGDFRVARDRSKERGPATSRNEVDISSRFPIQPRGNS